jgi:DNA polymerase-3 subunit epsilon
MRQVVLDTETTGLEPSQGHRIIEIGCRELVERRPTQRYYHQYLQPDREIDTGALEVHGISNEFLSQMPRFADIVDEFLAFISGAEVIIHNAPFDVAFINFEIQLLGGTPRRLEDYCSIVDTLALARERHPGQKNSLDTLCRRYGVDNSQRDLHGALLDAEILADVYLAMTGGQASLRLHDVSILNPSPSQHGQQLHNRPRLRVICATPEELAAHQERLAAIDEASNGSCLWKQLDSV